MCKPLLEGARWGVGTAPAAVAALGRVMADGVGALGSGSGDAVGRGEGCRCSQAGSTDGGGGGSVHGSREVDWVGGWWCLCAVESCSAAGG